MRIVIVTPAAYTLRQHGAAGYQCRLAWQSRAPAAATSAAAAGDVERALAYGREARPLLRPQQRATWLLEDMGVAYARRGAADLAAPDRSVRAVAWIPNWALS